MCLGDWRLGRVIRHQITNFTNTVATYQICAANNQRVAVNIAAVGVNFPTTYFVDVQIDSLMVFHLTGTVNFVHFDITQYGDLPTKSINIISTLSVGSIAVIEWFLPEDVLSAGIEEFMRQLGKGY